MRVLDQYPKDKTGLHVLPKHEGWRVRVVFDLYLSFAKENYFCTIYADRVYGDRVCGDWWYVAASVDTEEEFESRLQGVLDAITEKHLEITSGPA